jgi:MFS family permease
MGLKKSGEAWKYPLILLFGIGISNFGAWVYLIALNLIVLDMTQSPLAVAGLYLAKPIATLLTNGWAGSVIDRMNKRNTMVILDLVRALFIMILPFTSSLWIIYLLVLLINMASSMFEPAAMTYVTKLIPPEKRQRFNALRSLVDSGAFLLGPAIAGILFMLGTPTSAIYINAVALMGSGLVTMLMPNLEKDTAYSTIDARLSWTMIREDWKEVATYSRKTTHVVIIFFLFGCMMVMATAIDSQEASFAKIVLSLTNSEYGFLVSIAGAGIIVGAIVNTFFVKKLTSSFLIGGGSMVLSLGYFVYAFSSSFAVAATGFFILAFALAFANTGFHTFVQNNIPVEVMGRIVSLYGLLQAVLIIVTTLLVGFSAQWLSIQPVVIAATTVMFAISILLVKLCIQQSRREYQPENYIETEIS